METDTIFVILITIFVIMVILLPISYELRLGRKEKEFNSERKFWETERQNYIVDLLEVKQSNQQNDFNNKEMEFLESLNRKTVDETVINRQNRQHQHENEYEEALNIKNEIE